MASAKLLMAIAVTAELLDKVMSPGAARLLVDDLAYYSEADILAALTRCRTELRSGQFCLAAIRERIEDGRPGVEQAWAMLPMDESASVVWTGEMTEAWAVAKSLIDDGDRIGARMAFKEVYTQAVALARREHRPVTWSASIGYDKHEAARVINEAVARGRLPAPHAAALIGHYAPGVPLPHLLGLAPKMIPLPLEEDYQK